METQSHTAPLAGFRILGKEHRIILGLLLLTGCLMIVLFPRWTDEAGLSRLASVVSWLIFVFILAGVFFKWYAGNFNYRKDLPLDICNFCGILMPFAWYFDSEFFFQVLFYWILTGTFQGIITPEISAVFPQFHYFRYWFVHGGLVLLILYLTIVLGMKPSFEGIWVAFISLQLYVAILFVFNYLTNSNYGYLARKPETPTILDYLGDYPLYIFWTDVLALTYFILLYALNCLLS